MTAAALSAIRPGASPDRVLLAALGTIAILGLVMVASSSSPLAAHEIGDPLYFFYRQTIYFVLGIGAGCVIYFIPTRIWSAHPFMLLMVALGLLIMVLLPGVGHTVNGARRWIDLGLITVQVSEPARLLLILYLAGYAARHRRALVETWGGLLRPLLFVTLASLLLLLEPNFGAVAILAVIAVLMLFIAGARLSYLLVIGVIGSTVLVGAVMTSPYRMERIISFVHPWQHAQNTGFQLTQSLIAIGHGQLFGVGLGNSIQKLMYLPETHTDFLFAIYAAEFGFVGTLILIGLYLLVVWRGFSIARRALDAGHWFGGFTVYGLISWLGGQAFINIGVNMGLVPTKGLTLPLMSYGGSALVVICAMCGLIFRVDAEVRAARAEARS